MTSIMVRTTLAPTTFHGATITVIFTSFSIFVDLVTELEKNLASTAVVEQRAVFQRLPELLETQATAEVLAEPLDDSISQGSISELGGSGTADVGNDGNHLVELVLPEQRLESRDDFLDDDLADGGAVVLVGYHVDVEVV